MKLLDKKPPQPGTFWARVEEARLSLKWPEDQLSRSAFGENRRTHYTMIAARGWRSKTNTMDKLIVCLVEQGFSEVWLRAGIPPERSDKKALPEPPKVSARLAQLALKLHMPGEQLIALWADLEVEGPLERFPEKVQRAAFAAAYLDARSLDDVRLAVAAAQRDPEWRSGDGIDQILMNIRMALRHIRAGSGLRPSLAAIRKNEG